MSVRAIYFVADVLIEIYSGIARFRCDSMALVAHGQLSVKSVVFEASSYSYIIYCQAVLSIPTV